MMVKGLVTSGIAGAIMAGSAVAGAFVEPPVLASADGLLDLLVIAAPKVVPSISFSPPGGGSVINPVGWVYEICQRAQATGNHCPADSSTISDYGGVRLALQKGDLLKIRLVNQLPKLDPVKVTHSADPGGANLPLNPTNLHAHGLIVEARAPSKANPTFGDDIFVEIYNSGNGTPIPQTHQHGPVVQDFADYEIQIPANHPSGAYWFHPHVHGLSANQISSGMAGIISIGQAGDYASGDVDGAPFPEVLARHLILKDIQVLAAGNIQFANGSANVANGEVLSDGQDPMFCSQLPATTSEMRHGSCPGVDNSASGGNNYVGGQWYFTVSGRQYPTIQISAPDGELWRLTNAGASATYDLQLVDDATHEPMVMELVSVDGVSVNVPPQTSTDALAEMGGGRFKVVPCPLGAAKRFSSLPVCVTQFAMMPSSRAELWVTYRDKSGKVASPPAGATATLKTIGITTGQVGVGDPWPAVDLARIEFVQPAPRVFTAEALQLHGDALAANRPAGIFSAPNADAVAASAPAGCKSLPPGHRRRIFYGLVDPYNNPNVFGLGYEEVDERGAVVQGTQRPVRAFDPMNDSVCLPLGPGQTPVHETWELVNLATENHNFHIHQTKFRFVDPAASAGSPLAETLDPAVGAGVMEDNAPLPIAVANNPNVANKQNGYCTIDQWRSKECVMTPLVVDIPFSQLGNFVYHCHILEHEDGGMMARIQVVPSSE
jgi:L-ascorbate oxidase